jgi:hypothetical protein
VSRNSITTEYADCHSVEREGLRTISDRAYEFGDGQNPPIDVMRLVVASLAEVQCRQQLDGLPHYHYRDAE